MAEFQLKIVIRRLDGAFEMIDGRSDLLKQHAAGFVGAQEEGMIVLGNRDFFFLLCLTLFSF